jgi:hypothetical protein
MAYALLILFSFTAMLGWFGRMLTDRQVRPDGHLYYQVRPEDPNPFQPSRGLSPVAAWIRKTFYEAYYDGKGRLAFYNRWENGRKVETVYLTYDPSGRLVRTASQMRDGTTKVRKYMVDGGQ